MSWENCFFIICFNFNVFYLEFFGSVVIGLGRNELWFVISCLSRRNSYCLFLILMLCYYFRENFSYVWIFLIESSESLDIEYSAKRHYNIFYI